jgi:thiamine-monophosphate kinase
VEAVAAELGVDPREFAATAGEDYELCASVPAAHADAAARAAGLTWIGRVSAGAPSVSFAGAAGPLTGFEHTVG